MDTPGRIPNWKITWTEEDSLILWRVQLRQHRTPYLDCRPQDRRDADLMLNVMQSRQLRIDFEDGSFWSWLFNVSMDGVP